MQEVTAVSALDDDMLDGDLGDGMGARPPFSFFKTKSQSPSGMVESLLSDGGLLRRNTHSGEGVWKPKLKMAGWKQRACWKLPAPLVDISKNELNTRLQEAGEIIEILFCELEVAQRYLEGKYEALRILQGKAILDRATCHTKSLLQKSEEKAKTLEKEVNCLQWELSFSQVQLKKTEQSWEQRYNRIVSESRTCSEKLEKQESELQQLRGENSALNQQHLELLSMLKVKEQRTYLATKPQYTPEKDATVLELAVLGACRCISVNESCPCSRTAAATRKHLLQLQHELDFQHSRREEALMVADAFRIAFEQQLRKRSDRLMLLAETNLHKLNCKTEGVNKKPLVGVSQRLKCLLPPNLEMKNPGDLLEALYRLIDLLNDKEEALAHQRKVSIMLAHSAEELQKQLDLDSGSIEPLQNQLGTESFCHQVSDSSESTVQSEQGEDHHRNQPLQHTIADAQSIVTHDPAQQENINHFHNVSELTESNFQHTTPNHSHTQCHSPKSAHDPAPEPNENPFQLVSVSEDPPESTEPENVGISLNVFKISQSTSPCDAAEDHHCEDLDLHNSHNRQISSTTSPEQESTDTASL